MAEVFFQYEKIPYLFDTKLSKLFQIKAEKLIEINEPTILKNVRYKSLEIKRGQAFILVQRFMK
jgi:hypothetical protein